ncbi:MAG: hypothetical protein IKE68_07745 [Solobacterium sp.]|nr:hypothetical protein [Solobacterium sp.]
MAVYPALVQRIIRNGNVSYFNSNDHDTSLTFVASGQALVLSPGFLNDRNSEFVWIPYDCPETIPCVLCTHAADRRRPLQDLVSLICDWYADRTDV